MAPTADASQLPLNSCLRQIQSPWPLWTCAHFPPPHTHIHTPNLEAKQSLKEHKEVLQSKYKKNEGEDKVGKDRANEQMNSR